MQVEDTTASNIGISRRSLLKRSAVVGGTVWAVPVIQSLSAPAFAQAVTYGGGRTDISFIALVYQCGAGPRGIKIDVPDECQDPNTTSGCDLLQGCEDQETGATPGCDGNDFFGNTPAGSCADIASAVVDNNGNVTIVLDPGCNILRVAAKCGSACAQWPGSPHISVSGGSTTVSDNFCPTPVGS